MRLRLFFLLSLITCIAYSQQWELQGAVINGKTQAPVEFANIGVVNKHIGTVSGIDGTFYFSIKRDDVSASDLVQFSTIGFTSKTISVGQLAQQLAQNKPIVLEPVTYELDTVMLIGGEKKEVTLGNNGYSTEIYGYWRDSLALGGEIATKINIRKRNTSLNTLQFRVLENYSDSLLIRINIYDSKNQYPAKNLLTQNIYHTVTQRNGVEMVDLSPYRIRVSSDIIVSIELIKIYGNALYFVMAGSLDNGISYRRYVSQDKWIKHEVGMAMMLDGHYYKYGNRKSDLLRKQPERITLLWDNADRMRNRNTQEELTVLSQYLKYQETVEVTAIVTNSAETHTQTFRCEGECPEVISFLEQFGYMGTSNYTELETLTSSQTDAIVLFSDGTSVLSTLPESAQVPVFAINSLHNANHKSLQKLSFISDGHYVNLPSTPIDQAWQLMAYELADEKRYDEPKRSEEFVIGKVVNTEGQPINGAVVRVKNSFSEVITDGDGAFKVPASDGDVVIFSYIGVRPLEVTVNTGDKLTITMALQAELLDEVVLDGKPKKEKVQTVLGERDADAIATSVQRLTEKDIDASHQTLDQLIRKLPGVLVTGLGNDKRYSFPNSMGSSSTLDTNPIIVIDGIIYQQKDGLENLPTIDLQRIKSIEALKYAHSTSARFGTLGAYGAIIIKTEASAAAAQNKKIDTPSLLVQGNDYQYDAIDLTAALGTNAAILKLKNANSPEQLKALVLKQLRNNNQLGLDYFMDASDVLAEEDKQYAVGFLDILTERAWSNPKVLRALAYKYEQFGAYERALTLTEKVLALRPEQMQGYLQLARTLYSANKITAAYENYKAILVNTKNASRFDELRETAETELKHLVAFHRSEVPFQELPNDLLNANAKQDIRMVLEWSDPSTEFTLQFVNPDNKFYNYSHDQFDNPNLMKNHIENGYMGTEFVIDEAEAGQWKVNLQYRGNYSGKTPPYLRYTRYVNYGLPSEEKIVKVIPLVRLDKKTMLDSFQYRKEY
tara:strand:+ start:5236 stop:8253 length:3018 start_codon:yes stop_codon:yes gene_type:complete